MVRSGKQHVIAAGFAFFRATRLHRLLAPLTRGQGVILTLHRVQPWEDTAFAPNRLLEIEPAFLDAALAHVKTLGFDLVSLDEALRRLGRPDARPFVALTFDDGYRDTVEHALPILERHGAPFTLFVTTGFAERTARLWWVELEEAVRTLPSASVTINGTPFKPAAVTTEEKTAAFSALYWHLRQGPEHRLLAVIADLLAQAGLSSAAIAERLCLDWPAIQAVTDHPLCTIGVHTLTHPMLAKHGADAARREMAASRALIEARIGRPALHFSYPVGDPGSAGPREFALARELGFASAVTTRPGPLFPGHRNHLHALPRVSLNGHWQTLASLEVLLSGVPFALWNRGRRVDAA